MIINQQTIDELVDDIIKIMYSMRILWYNWKDITNPTAGGAEVLTHEITKRLVKNGCHVTIFCSTYQNCKNAETVDGVKIVRRGGKYSVYMEAKKYYKQNSNYFDLVIDEINTRPFMTIKFVNKPIVALIHQLAREFWFYETKFPINVLGRFFLENHWLRHYRKIPIFTVSQSTKIDLVEIGFKNISIIPEGLAHKPLDKLPNKESTLTLIFVGRLRSAKLPDDAIKSFFEIKKTINDVQLWIVGDGERRRKLERLAKKSDSIVFWGKVSNEKKLELMGRAHLLLVPAVREGWGLVVTEANSMGTPAVGYNVHGIRDSITDGKTGILTKNDPESLAKEVIKILPDVEYVRELSINALLHSRQFSWDKTTEIFKEHLNKYLDNSVDDF